VTVVVSEHEDADRTVAGRNVRRAMTGDADPASEEDGPRHRLKI
jgi:hypothetical protein